MVEQYHFAEINLSMQTWTKRAVCGVGVKKVDWFRQEESGRHKKETDAGAGESHLTGATWVCRRSSAHRRAKWHRNWSPEDIPHEGEKPAPDRMR